MIIINNDKNNKRTYFYVAINIKTPTITITIAIILGLQI